MHAVLYGKTNTIAYKILGFEARTISGQDRLGFRIESAGALAQESWVMIVKGLMVKPIDDIEPELFTPLDERKGGHVRKHRQAKTPWAIPRISVCGMCGEYLVLDDNGHVCGDRKIAEPRIFAVDDF